MIWIPSVIVKKTPTFSLLTTTSAFWVAAVMPFTINVIKAVSQVTRPPVLNFFGNPFALVILVTLLAAVHSHASILQDQKVVGWFLKRDLTSAQFSHNFDDYRSQGYLMIDVDAYPYRQETRYSMVWCKNPDGRGWAENRDMNSATYHEKWQ